MLFNPSWEKVFTTEEFRAWLLKQPADKHYAFIDVDRCAVAQYLQANGLESYMSCDRMKELGWVDIVCSPGKDTFGKAARRAYFVSRGGWLLSVARFFAIAGLV